jgi:hypothetical protein
VWGKAEQEMANAIMKPKKTLAEDRALVKEGWKLYEQADPEPVYLYLARVYGVVRAWPKADRARCARELLKLANKQAPAKSEPFAVVILCTSKSDWVDNKLRNRWSRALQLADQHNVNPKGLRNFIQSQGGLAKCARKLF